MEDTTAREGELSAGKAAKAAGRRQLLALLRSRLTPRLTATLALWRVEAYLATPLALLLVATLGRWPAAFAMGSIMAVYSALFLFLLDGQPVLHDIHGWGRGRWLGRLIESLADARGFRASARRAVALPWSVVFMGPFWRAVTYHLFRVPRLASYALSVGGSIPHSLLWTGLVLGGVWEALIRPALQDLGV